MTTSEAAPILRIKNLTTVFGSGSREVVAVSDVSFDIGRGEIVGVVGESGCGKSVTASSILRLVPAPGRVKSGEILFEGRDILAMDQEELRRLRGNRVSMVFQDPMSSLNPVFQVGDQIVETMQVHEKFVGPKAMPRARYLMERVRIPDAADRMRDYPHQFSGGMRQRIMIGLGLANEPALILADEPTTALDVTVQAEIVALIQELNRATGTAVLLISHNIALVGTVCSRIIVMYAGQVVEQGAVDDIMSRPQHPYTWSLLRTAPTLDVRRTHRLPMIPGMPPNLANLPSGCRFRDRCPFAVEKCQEEPPLVELPHGGQARCWFRMDALQEQAVHSGRAATVESARVSDRDAPTADGAAGAPLLVARGLRKEFKLGSGMSRGRGHVVAVDGVDLELWPGETLGLVGESGSGKSTLGRLLLYLETPTSGEVCFASTSLNTLSAKHLRATRRRMQMVFQDSGASLNPMMTVEQIISEPLRNFEALDRATRHARVAETLELCGLSTRFLDRYPHEFSGGQRQRIGIARALVLRPQLVVADEPVSALDVSIQAQIINLLEDLQEALNLSYVFVSHDLAVVKHIADRVAVMSRGRIVESGPCEAVYANPVDDYTKTLLAAVPALRSSD
jgi:peptide/nickel transport system ATP-binding protein